VLDFVQLFSQTGQPQLYNPETDSRSRFDILNTGQNFTTWMFSRFMQTTTIDLIDKLADEFHYDKSCKDARSF
jgi:hypothetical protein